MHLRAYWVLVIQASNWINEKGSDQLLNDSLIVHKQNFINRELSVDLLMMSLESPCI